MKGSFIDNVKRKKQLFKCPYGHQTIIKTHLEYCEHIL